MSQPLRVQDGVGVVIYGPDPNKALLYYKRGAPSNGEAGYEPGCLLTDITNGVVYWNAGSTTSSSWSVVGGLDASGGLVNVTAASLTVTAALHANRVTRLNRATGVAVALPAATGTGNRYTFFVGTTMSGGSTTITTNGSDVYNGNVVQIKTSDGSIKGYTAATSTVITLDGSTQGGVKGDLIELIDQATGVWSLKALTSASGSVATPLS